ncbi:MAG: DUF4340 domain-containing protein [Lentisphaeria bacterium]|nr:DUF4340 domain-containing protein [Lentisphaeria bacterium]
MKTKHFLISLVVFSITLLYYQFGVHNQTDYNQGQPVPFMPEFSEQVLDSIQFKHDNELTTLTSTDQGWFVKERNQYPADFAKVKQFITDLKESQVQRNLQVGNSQLGRLELLEDHKKNGGTTVTLFDKSQQVIKTFLLGKKYTVRDSGVYIQGRGKATGCYALIDNKVALLDRPFNATSAKPNHWLDRSFINLGEIVRLQISFFNSMQDNWEIKQTAGAKKKELKFQGLKQGEKANITNIRKIMPFFQAGGSDFSDVATNPEILKNNRPFAGITIENSDGFIYQLVIGVEVGSSTLCNLKIKTNKSLSESATIKLKREQKYENYTYQLSTAKLKGLLQVREKMIKKK